MKNKNLVYRRDISFHSKSVHTTLLEYLIEAALNDSCYIDIKITRFSLVPKSINTLYISRFEMHYSYEKVRVYEDY